MPAVNLSKDHVLFDKAEAAKVSVEKAGLAGRRLAVYLVGDHSGSMHKYYKNGSMQDLGDRVLGLSVHFDDDGKVPVILFDAEAHDPVEIDVNDSVGAMDKVKARAGRMRSTDYVAAMKAVRKLHKKRAKGQPGLVIFQTDGAPNSRSKTTDELVDAAQDPLFWMFIGFGDERDIPPGEGARFDYLRGLDTMQGRAVDNAGFFPAGDDPQSIPDGVLYDALLAEVPSWLAAYEQRFGFGRRGLFG
jgi:hypothetical protein